MAYNDQKLLEDVDGQLINQHYDPTQGTYRPAQGSDGALWVQLPEDRSYLEAAAKGGVAPGGTDLLAFSEDPGPHTGLDGYEVKCLEPTTFDDFQAEDCTVPTGYEWPAGTTISSTAGVTALTLGSGAVQLKKNA